MCIGQHLAMLEAKMVLGTLFKNLDLTVHNNMKVLCPLTLRPDKVDVTSKVRRVLAFDR